MPVLRSQLILALGVEELMRAVVVGFGHEHFGGAVQIAVIRLAGVDKFLRRNDAVLLEHHDEHLGIDDRAGIEKPHANKLTTIYRAEASEGGMGTP